MGYYINDVVVKELNLPQCSQGVLPPNFQQFVIVWPGFPQCPQLTGQTYILRRLTLSLSIIHILGYIFSIT